MEHIKAFTRYLKFEVESFETDVDTGEVKTEEPETLDQHLFFGKNLPRMALNTTRLRMRADPSF